MSEKLTVKQFFARFPDDDKCLEHVMDVRYGLRHTCEACGVDATFHKITGRKAYACAQCGDHVYPCAGTIFEDSRTSLQSWFYAIYLFIATRHGVSGKELQRSLGVTYKTAWRMGHQIRKLMDKADVFHALRGHVEMDEAFIGGKRKHSKWGGAGKTVVFGMVERGGRTHAEVVPNASMPTLKKVVLENVEPGTKISTDEWPSYGLLSKHGYDHGTLNHRAYEFKKGEHHTNSIESFWRLFKASVRSTHIHVSPKYMNQYLREFTFRANHRVKQNAMFDLLIASV